MAAVLIISGLLGASTYYASLSALINKEVGKQDKPWLRLIGVPALFISISATAISSYFGAKPTLWLSAAIWPIVALTLHSGYKVVTDLLDQQMDIKEDGDKDD